MSSRYCATVKWEGLNGKVPMKQQSRHHNFYRKRGLLIVTALMFSSLVLMDVNLLHAEENMTFTLKSTAFGNGGEIPSRYTCEGEDVSPPWYGLVFPKLPEVWF